MQNACKKKWTIQGVKSGKYDDNIKVIADAALQIILEQVTPNPDAVKHIEKTFYGYTEFMGETDEHRHKQEELMRTLTESARAIKDETNNFKSEAEKMKLKMETLEQSLQDNSRPSSALSGTTNNSISIDLINEMKKDITEFKANLGYEMDGRRKPLERQSWNEAINDYRLVTVIYIIEVE